MTYLCRFHTTSYAYNSIIFYMVFNPTQQTHQTNDVCIVLRFYKRIGTIIYHTDDIYQEFWRHPNLESQLFYQLHTQGRIQTVLFYELNITQRSPIFWYVAKYCTKSRFNDTVAQPMIPFHREPHGSQPIYQSRPIQNMRRTGEPRDEWRRSVRTSGNRNTMKYERKISVSLLGRYKRVRNVS